MADFRFIAGLGNPGLEYERTRHNIGFLLLDALAHAQSGSVGWKGKRGAETSDIELEGTRVTLIKPLEFMNLSGGPIAQILQFVKAPPSELIVVHDDIDLPYGMIRVRPEGEDGGHRGIRSIIESLGTDKFVRLKLGVGRPEGGEVRDWVLERFSKQEVADQAAFMQKSIEALKCLMREGVKVAQNKFNVRVKPKAVEDTPR